MVLGFRKKKVLEIPYKLFKFLVRHTRADSIDKDQTGSV